MNGITAVYVGNHNIIPLRDEVKTKYCFAGSTRLAVCTDGTLRFLLSDHLGSSSVTTNANGAKTASALYKAFGETRYTLGSLNTDYKFTGQREEASLGIYFFNARWYDGSLGRFLSPDTIVPTSTQGTQAWDRYAFVNNNPVRYTDPRGHGVDCGFGEDCVGNQTNPNDPTTTTVYAGGVNPASRPEIANDSNSGPSHPIVDGIVELYTFVQSFIASFVPNPSTEVDVLYTYTVNPDGSISQIIITVNNHDGGSSVALENVVIGMDDKAMHRPPFSVREGEYILDANHMVVNPGQSRRAIICGNCIAENPLLFFMPIHKNTQVTITSIIGGYFDFGNQGTNYAQLPITFIIPAR